MASLAPVLSTPSAEVLKAAFSRDMSDSDDDMAVEDSNEPEAMPKERTFKDSVHGLSASALFVLIVPQSDEC